MAQLENRKTPLLVDELHSEHPDIVAASEAAYDKIFNHYRAQRLRQPPREQTHRGRYCGPASRLMSLALNELGYPVVATSTYAIEERQRGSYVGRGFTHTYLLARAAKGVMVIDPTWQQFITYDTGEEFPKVMVGTREEAVKQAVGACIMKPYPELWQRSPTDTIFVPKPTDVQLSMFR